MKDELFGEALLVLTQDDKPLRNWSLTEKVTTIGRWDDNDVVIPDRWVSRHHAEIHREGVRYVIHDLDSKNGLYVNGTRISGSIALEDGDQIQIAPRCQLTFVDSEATAPALQRQRGVLIDEDETEAEAERANRPDGKWRKQSRKSCDLPHPFSAPLSQSGSGRA